MIDPQKVTDYNRSEEDLELFILFSVAVAGKTAKIIASAVDRFLSLESSGTPFEKIRAMHKKGTLEQNVKQAKLGKWSTLTVCYADLAFSEICLKTCTPYDLEKFKGIGPKTSRFFIMHSRPNQRVAALDTHILAYLRDQGYEVPKTPSNKKYAEIENIFIDHADSIGRGDNLAAFDLEIWNAYSKRSGTGQPILVE